MKRKFSLYAEKVIYVCIGSKIYIPNPGGVPNYIFKWLVVTKVRKFLGKRNKAFKILKYSFSFDIGWNIYSLHMYIGVNKYKKWTKQSIEIDE